MQISLVIPTFNRCSSVLRLLDALTDQTLAADQFEVIVSIDGSTDGTYEAIQQFDAPYVLRAIRHENQGRAGACNLGILDARAPIIVILDDDMVPSPALLGAHRAAHDGAERRCVLGPVPVSHDAVSPPLTKYIARKFGEHLERCGAPGYSFGARDFYSGNASFRRDDLVGVGMFDDSFVEYGNEDLELAVRLRASGVSLSFAPAAVAQQCYEKSFRSLAADTAAKGRTAVQFVDKHPTVLRELTIGQPDLRSTKWRSARRAMVFLLGVLPATERLVVGATSLFERSRLPGLDVWYAFVLDCQYWLGVEQGRSATARANGKLQGH